MGTPIKLEGSSGDLKQMTTTEENYLAYRAGLHLASIAQTDAAALTTSSSSSVSIGSYLNTFFNQAVGTHPGTSISSGSTSTTLYQKTGTASESGVDFHRPIHWNTDKFEEMDDTELNALCDRLIGVMFANTYPGTYVLGSTSPGADYDIHIADAFSDTRADGTDVAYNIYQRQSMTAPTAVRSVKVLNDDSSFDGLKEMTDAEISYTLGSRIRTRIMSSTDNIGAYQLRSSAQGAPTATGTWVAKGTATDTKQNLADVAYSGTYSATYTGNFIGNYTGVYSGTYTRNRATEYSATYTGNFIGNYTGVYSGTYSRTRVTDYTRSSVNPNAINYVRSRPVGYAQNYYGAPTYFYTFIGNYLGPAYYTGNFVGNFVGNYTGAYSGTYSRDRTEGFLGNYVGNYSGQTIQSSSSTVETYTLYVRTA